MSTTEHAPVRHRAPWGATLLAGGDPLRPYRCEAVAYQAGTNREWLLGRYAAPNTGRAVGWLRHRAVRFAVQLGPGTAWIAREWARDRSEAAWAARLLAEGEPYSFTLPDGDVLYRLTARPAPATALSRRAAR
ncbi:hypothetical protein ACIQGZ_25925 [Streptomyces sp. NPDC092296]|uniref:hypothetical protein n=1 Tax=Streptomyces sp. NPDC092296 TaxID=3366012 RepID=UPI0037F45DD7